MHKASEEAEMTEIALYGREDGLLEPRYDKGMDFIKERAGKLLIGQFAADTRSNLQNRFLNGWVYSRQICTKLNDAGIMVSGIPWTRDILHAVFQDQFLVKFEIKVDAMDVKVYESTADMSKKRFSRYIDDQIRPFVYETWEITVDDPNEGYWLEVMREIQR